MIIKCFRCGKEIDTPDSSNADYVIAEDMVTREPREVLIALKHNQETLKKKAMIAEREPFTDEQGSGERQKYPDLVIDDSEYDKVVVPNAETARKAIGEDLVMVVIEERDTDVQKTGIICPECFKSTDFVIWGVHKAEAKSKGLG